jgi:hypothetical protein
LVMEKRMYISYGRDIWSVNLDGHTYKTPTSLTHYMAFLETNYTRIHAAYQAPSGNIVLFVDDMVYAVTYPDFHLVPSWPKTMRDFGLPHTAVINGAVNTNRGRSYVMYDGTSVGEIDECQSKVVRYTPLETTFPGIPASVTSIFRYMDGNLYFIARKQYYRFNEFTGTVTAAGTFDLQLINITCPKNDLLRQLRDLLSRIVRVSNALSPLSHPNDDDDDDDDKATRIRRRVSKNSSKITMTTAEMKMA